MINHPIVRVLHKNGGGVDTPGFSIKTGEGLILQDSP